MKKNHPILFVGLLLTLALLSAALWSVASAAQDDTPVTDRAVVERAWALTHKSNSFAYTSRITQTVHPAATLGNIGRTPQTDQIGLQGRLDRAAESVDLTLWPDAAFDPDSGIALQLRGNRAYQRAEDGTWREVENMTGLASPGGDPLAFLSGIANVTAAGSESRALPGTGVTVSYTRYTFDFDGAPFAEHVRVATQRQMQAAGDLLPQMELERSAVLAQTTGSGEVWIDEYGLPVRLSLSLDLGEQANGERGSAEITTDLSDFDLTGISAAATPFHRDPALWLRTRLLTSAVADTAASTALVLVVLAAVVLSIPYWQHRRFYTGMAIALVFSMVVPPLLDTYQVHAFSTNQAARQAQFEADRTEADSFRAAQEQLTATTWQPLQNPLPAGRDQMLFDNLPTSFPLQYTSVITATDTDGDGLSDADEDIYESCADPLLCPDLDATDSDGDGLGDGLEVHALGTLPNSWDTDDDLITDTLEISGFSYNGLTWYLDPTEADSNRDGLSDTIECEVWTDISPLFDPLAACPDTDGDGTPDVFDSDNDNDGVHDSVDLSPFDASTVSFSGAAPFELTVSNAAVGQPLLVDLQIRPNNPDHLTYYNSVLDWPSGDTLGQVVRTASTTWADTLNTDLQSTDANAANGDIRLVPLLEVTIPYTTGHYANLPVLESAPITRTQTMTVGQWLDTTELTAHGLSVVDAPDGSGDLVLYAPLVLQKNETEGGPAAFYARLFYWPEQGSGGFVNWGSRQQARLAWSVQMLVNDCTTPGDPTTCSATDKLAVVHRYVDDWTLTGMTIAEQHGYDVALLYEDPDSDPDLTADDQLWALSWQLGNTFLRGRDCEPFVAEVCQPDGQRDVQIDNVVLRMNDWFTDTIYTVVGANSYPHIGYQGYVATVDVPNVLNNDFATHTDIQPTILFMQETTQRSTALGDGIVLNGVLATADLDPTVHSLDVVTGLNWAPYHYLDGSWQSMPLSTYLSGLVATYQTVPFFQPLDASVPLSVDEADGKLIWLQLYYATLVEGVTQLVQTDSTLLWAPFPTPELPEFSVTSSSLPSRSRTGVSWVAYEWKGNLDVIANVPKGQGSGWGWFVYRLRLNAEANRLTVGLKKNFFNSTRIGTYNLALQGAMLATATAVAALAAGGLLSGNSVVQDVGKYVGLVLSIVVLTIAFETGFRLRGWRSTAGAGSVA
ncbi:MAG: thrombospondin type 3 repeat-containing protein [Anaerolineae bacterium]|nr:thrombospondin type 3 repeat-containing protein [Anaerolineae bacterium]